MDVAIQEPIASVVIANVPRQQVRRSGLRPTDLAQPVLKYGGLRRLRVDGIEIGAGHTVARMAIRARGRSQPSRGIAFWSVSTQFAAEQSAHDLDVLVHLTLRGRLGAGVLPWCALCGIRRLLSRGRCDQSETRE